MKLLDFLVVFDIVDQVSQTKQKTTFEAAAVFGGHVLYTIE